MGPCRIVKPERSCKEIHCQNVLTWGFSAPKGIFRYIFLDVKDYINTTQNQNVVARRFFQIKDSVFG